MSPAQALALYYLAGTVVGYVAGSMLPWWIAGLPCYVAAGATYAAARTDKENTREDLTAYGVGMLMGSLAAATVVSMVCDVPHGTAVLDGLDPCAAPIVIALLAAVVAWGDERWPPRWPDTPRSINVAAFILYAVTVASALLLRRWA